MERRGRRFALFQWFKWMRGGHQKVVQGHASSDPGRHSVFVLLVIDGNAQPTQTGESAFKDTIGVLHAHAHAGRSSIE